MTLKNIRETRLFFEKCKSVKDSFKSRTYSMTDDKGNLLLNPKIIVNNFQFYFENLLNSSMHHEIDNANGIWELAKGQMYATVESKVPEPTLEDIKISIPEEQ